MNSALGDKIEQLEGLSHKELQNAWVKQYKASAPQISLALLRMGLAWKLQVKASGGLSREAQRLLGVAPSDTSSIQPTRKLTPGTRLVRDWHGEGHTVTVLEDGFDYNGATWRSLSAIAKAITGTHWNGPRFFGLTNGGDQ